MNQKTQKQRVPNQEDVHRILGKAFWKLTERYKLTQKDIAILLGLNPEYHQRVKNLQRKKEIPKDPDKELRVSHLIGIHKNLRILFPQNREIVYSWFKTKRDLLGGKSAMEYIAEGPAQGSLPRLYSIRRLLDQIRVSG